MRLNGRELNPADASSGGMSIRGPSRLSAIRRCERAWDFRYQQGLRPKDKSEPALLGTAFHQLRAFYWGTRLDPSIREKSHYAWLNDDPDEVLAKICEGRPAAFTQARKMLDHYAEWVSESSAKLWEPVAIEEQFVCTVGDLMPDCEPGLRDEVVSCRVDSVFRVMGPNGDPLGKVIVDCKTSASKRGDTLPWWNGDFKALSFQGAMNLHIIRAAEAREASPLPVLHFAHERVRQYEPFDIDVRSVDIPPDLYDWSPGATACAIAGEMVVELRGEAHPTGALTGGCYLCDYKKLCAVSSTEEREERKTKLFTTD
jgi:hypothetical protein